MLMIRHPEKPYENEIIPSKKVISCLPNIQDKIISFYIKDMGGFEWSFESEDVFKQFVDAYSMELIQEKKVFESTQSVLAAGLAAIQSGDESPFN